MKTSKIAIIAIVAALCVTISLAAASYLITAPQSDPVTVNPTPTPPPEATLSKVQVSATTIEVGDELTLTTTLSDHTAGLTVSFYIVGTDDYVGDAATDASGVASLTIAAQQAGTFRFYATAEHP